MLQTGYTLALENNNQGESARFINQQLDLFNFQFTGPYTYQPLLIAIRDPQQAILAGLVGETFWHWLHIDTLWVSEALRGSGYGTLLLQNAESEAKKRACIASVLETHSFQALPFYEKNGYTVFGALENFPPGAKKYFLRKYFNS